jgi:hypothetical protein
MKSTKEFKNTIERYITDFANGDPLFALRAGNPKKNIDDCITFILNQVRQSGSNGFTDEEIYSLAVHYYIEEDIDVGKPVQCRVIVNHHVQLTEEEITEQRQKAKEKVFSEEVSRLKSSGKVSAPAETKPAESGTGLLFAFD